MQPTIKLLDQPTKYMFFTGKGGVGKTSVSTAVSIALADAGKRVLLVSTDAASNLDEMLGVELSNQPVAVSEVPGMFVLNIDPEAAAIDYRARVVEQMGSQASDQDIALVREQLSGACTTEIATFDEFAHLLSEGAAAYDYVVFDTAPTGHTLRLLSLPKAWSGFLEGNDRGASCLGPHSGLKMQEQLFKQALAALNNSALTTVVLVTRPDKGALDEAAHSSDELRELGLVNQRLVVNAVFKRSDLNDPIAAAIEAIGQRALDQMPASLRQLSADYISLKAVDSVGLPALRGLLAPEPARPTSTATQAPSRLEHHTLSELIAELANDERGLIMVMGKGGVGKTTIAAAVALGLVQHGKSVHLSTTDPAAHLAVTLNADVKGLSVGRIDPKVETQKYVDKIVASRAPTLTEAEIALLIEDLRSPCTEEVAVFHAFSRVVSQARTSFVVLDTAPTGHSLLLMDATGAYHRQMLREFKGRASDHIVTPLMRLQDANYTKILLVTLPEATPVSQAAALQDDLRRANIEPYAWVVNKSLLATATTDPLLRARLDSEQKQMTRVADQTSHAVIVVPWTAEPPVGVAALKHLLD
ncbi:MULTISPECIES: arsenical pump-driving ATPase [unclassified Pseudomonas]|uniref:arsenical pump-driving ATPase n=1 Tax=unclassified Pseudomonas TaxID=196821 RepID=UPI000C88A1EA|nr:MULTISPECIES: arsenical pump-driving ATPase [unclassified Pseudomonas]PMX27766.1 arsenical pump-driving ATPase [Pseudomonas sp. GW460-12]PMX35835.1 arsenical pump-driving ATPase [Pseudomonas sp. MPR-R2A4]PMX43492.1 arsenical pump-driving ATPase [Pseudomonas sp. MPR-R2A7]PMX55176.1 arsenical pump-driving ATPase [Pseudomonas sp. MPR-R2A6]PMX92630.1 arsenical pump-driving ATPase [Pseudomonas sp. MPR-R2A3]